MTMQCCTNQIFAFKWEYLSLTHSFPVLSKNITINDILPKNRFFGLHFCHSQFGSNFNYFDVIGSKSAKFTEITQYNGHYTVEGHSVITCGTKRKPYA